MLFRSMPFTRDFHVICSIPRHCLRAFFADSEANRCPWYGTSISSLLRQGERCTRGNLAELFDLLNIVTCPPQKSQAGSSLSQSGKYALHKVLPCHLLHISLHILCQGEKWIRGNLAAFMTDSASLHGLA